MAIVYAAFFVQVSGIEFKTAAELEKVRKTIEAALAEYPCEVDLHEYAGAPDEGPPVSEVVP